MKWDKSDRQSLVQLAYASTIGIAMVLTIFGGLYSAPGWTGSLAQATIISCFCFWRSA